MYIVTLASGSKKRGWGGGRGGPQSHTDLRKAETQASKFLVSRGKEEISLIYGGDMCPPHSDKQNTP